MSTVAVIDIGSNSIKLLVAARSREGALATLATASIDARISSGIGRENPRLDEAGMASGLEAIRRLLAEAAPHQPSQTALIATSAVRDARNGGEFCRRVQALTGHPVRVLDGEEEANLIGRGLTCDPACAELKDFHVFDLGGGSLECLAFRARRIMQAVSFPLGCVRLTERFVPDPAAPFSAETRAAIQDHVRAVLSRSDLALPLPEGTAAVGSGGTLATARAMLAAHAGTSFENTSAVITAGQLETLLQEIATLPLAERRKVPGLPPARADVFPAALATLLAVSAVGKISSFRTSLFNLRYGVAAKALGL